MASAWGKAWGSAWGSAWGRIERKTSGGTPQKRRSLPEIYNYPKPIPADVLAAKVRRRKMAYILLLEA